MCHPSEILGISVSRTQPLAACFSRSKFACEYVSTGLQKDRLRLGLVDARGKCLKPPLSQDRETWIPSQSNMDLNLDSEDQAPSSSSPAHTARCPDVTPGTHLDPYTFLRAQDVCQLLHAFFLPPVELKSTQIMRDTKCVASPFQAQKHIQLLHLSLRGKGGYCTHFKDEDTEV